MKNIMKRSVLSKPEDKYPWIPINTVTKQLNKVIMFQPRNYWNTQVHFSKILRSTWHGNYFINNKHRLNVYVYMYTKPGQGIHYQAVG